MRKGTSMYTGSDGTYRMRLVLSQQGERALRVVGVGNGHEGIERARFTVTVH